MDTTDKLFHTFTGQLEPRCWTTLEECEKGKAVLMNTTIVKIYRPSRGFHGQSGKWGVLSYG